MATKPAPVKPVPARPAEAAKPDAAKGRQAAPANEEPAEAPVKKSKTGKLFKPLIAVLATVLVLALSWRFLLHDMAMEFLTDSGDAAAAEGKPAEAKAAPEHAAKKAPAFVPLDQFTVNLHEENSDKYLQVGVILEVADAVTAEAVKTRLPIIRSQILLMLSAKHSADLQGKEGKQKLAQEILVEVRGPLDTPGPDKGVSKVHFSGFLVQ